MGRAQPSLQTCDAIELVLYVVNFVGVKHDRPEIQRGATFLVSTQREDGSWPMTSRLRPRVEKAFTNPVPITYFGSVWPTIGLVRALPSCREVRGAGLRKFAGHRIPNSCATELLLGN
jgi:hypothetical protein